MRVRQLSIYSQNHTDNVYNHRTNAQQEVLWANLLRKRDLKKVHPIITLLIWLLLFILGIEVGSNEEIIRGLHTIGYEAVVLTLGGTLGSVIAAWALWRALYKGKEAGHERKSLSLWAFLYWVRFVVCAICCLLILQKPISATTRFAR